jgi:CheY-like chemotaxis protein
MDRTSGRVVKLGLDLLGWLPSTPSGGARESALACQARLRTEGCDIGNIPAGHQTKTWLEVTKMTDANVDPPQQMVLIADDEPALRLLVAATIESDEYGLLEAEDGNMAWAMIEQHRPAVALLDVQMPGQTGLDIARRIKAEPALAGTRVILLTSKSRPQDVEAGLAAGADLYLTKPFSPLELVAALDQALGLS